MLWNVSNYKNNIHYTYLYQDDYQITHILTPRTNQNIKLDRSLFLKLKPILLKKFIIKYKYSWVKNVKKLTFINDKDRFRLYKKYFSDTKLQYYAMDAKCKTIFI